MLIRLLSILMVVCGMGSNALLDIAPQLSMDGVLFLVNRDYKITSAYEPDDLILPDVSPSKSSVAHNIYMRAEAAHALEALFKAAKEEENFNLVAVSGYRSYGTQAALFSNKVAAVGSAAKAQRTVAPAGASEHQLGLAMDINSRERVKTNGLNASFGTTAEGIWVAANAHRFGFIVRYQQGWEDITGYAYEPWHIRYVGVAHATAMYELDLPMETYIEQLRLVLLGELAKEQAGAQP